jgi:hypothetical protein
MAKVEHLRELAGGYEFGISAAPGEFHRVIERLKRHVPQELRSYDGDTHKWFVNNRFISVLERLFSNWESAVDEIESQLVLFS